MLFKNIFLIVIILSLTSCYAESQKNLHSGMQAFNASTFMIEKISIYKNVSSENEYLQLTRDGNFIKIINAKLSPFLKDDLPTKATIITIVTHPSFPESGHYIAVEKKGDTFNYYPFIRIDQTNTLMMGISSSTIPKVTSPEGLINYANIFFNAEKKSVFRPATPKERTFAIQQFNEHHN